MGWCIEKLPENDPKYKDAVQYKWIIIEKTKHFEMQRRLASEDTTNNQKEQTSTCLSCSYLFTVKKCLLCATKKFRIITKHNISPHVIAKANKSRKIRHYWNIIQEEIQPMLSVFEQEHSKKLQTTLETKKEKPRGTLKTFFRGKRASGPEIHEPHQHSAELSATVLEFILMKVAALMKDNEMYKQGITTLNQNYFCKTFPVFKDTEKAQIFETCGLWTEQYCLGVLCVTQNYILFIEAKYKRNFFIPIRSVQEIQFLEYPFRALKFNFTNEESFQIVELRQSEETYTLIKKIWREAVRRSIKGEDNKPLHLTPKVTRRNHQRSRSTDLHGSGIMDKKEPAKMNSLYADTTATDEFEMILPIFSNPALETLLQVSCTLFRSQKKDAKTKEGYMEISYRSLHFSSWDKVYVVTIPFIDIEDICYTSTDTAPVCIEIQMKSNARNIFIALEHKDVTQFICQLHKTFYGEESTFSFLSETPHDKQWPEKQKFFSSIIKELKHDKSRWQSYFDYFGRGSTIIRTRALLDLILQGIPNSLRPMMWQVTSGSYYSRINEAIPYSHYLQKAKLCLHNKRIGTKDQKNCIDEILRDINRSLPHHPFYKEDGIGVESLTNILIAYSWRNPTIGYCQGMNIIGAVLLLFLPEEDAFFLLCTIVEDIFPDYYTKSMIGSLVDLEILNDLLKQHQPKIHAHIEENIGGVSIVAVPWIMCMFIHCLPWESTLLAIDLILAEGSRAVFLISLAIFQSLKKEILALKSENLVELVKNQLPNYIKPVKLQKYIQYYDNVISQSTITLLRAKYKPILCMKPPLDDFSDPEDSSEGVIDCPRDKLPESDSNTQFCRSPQCIYDSKLMAENLKRFEKMVKENDSSLQKPSIIRRRYIASSGPSLTPKGRRRSTVKQENSTRGNLRISLSNPRMGKHLAQSTSSIKRKSINSKLSMSSMRDFLTQSSPDIQKNGDQTHSPFTAQYLN